MAGDTAVSVSLAPGGLTPQAAPQHRLLCCLQHVALCVKLIASWYVPDVPQSVKNTFLDRKHKNLRKELRWVMPRGACQGSFSPSLCYPGPAAKNVLYKMSCITCT